MKINTIRSSLKSIFQPQFVLETARQTGFTKRFRQLSPVHLVGAIVQTLSSQPKANLADIHRTFGSLTGTMPNYKPFHNQLKKEELTRLMAKIVNEATSRWLLKPFQDALPVNYPFKNIHLHDGSSLKLHPGLAETFPGRFTKKLIVGAFEHNAKSRIDKTDTRPFVNKKNPIGRVLQYSTCMCFYFTFRNIHVKLSSRQAH